MTVKTTFKSHFKIKKNFKKNLNKFIFVKNIVVFFLFFKVFFKNCFVSLSFFKKKKLQTNLLKAPSRHKKFFHQIFYEYFILKTFFRFFNKTYVYLGASIPFFIKMNSLFEKFGSNILTKCKFSVRFGLLVDKFFII